MRVLHVRNVHHALTLALKLLEKEGVRRDSRNGPVVMSPVPVTTVYERPRERVMFHPWRDANPFFHFYESLWMLAGRNDVKSLTRYVDRMKSFSDNGQHFNAAYGFRWRQSRGDLKRVDYDDYSYNPRDQLRDIIARLKSSRDDRRCVLQIWDHEYDLRAPGDTQTKDSACNVAATFQVGVDGRLDMSLFCRSNDVIWGAYGANAVHFSMLQEYVASFVGVPVGTLTQISVNWHAYEDVLKSTVAKWKDQDPSRTYHHERYMAQVEPYPLVMNTTMEEWDLECHHFTDFDGVRPPGGRDQFDELFFRNVAWPIVAAHDAYRDLQDEERFDYALEQLSKCEASDWRIACQDWLKRRQAKWMRERDDGVNYEETT